MNDSHSSEHDANGEDAWTVLNAEILRISNTTGMPLYEIRVRALELFALAFTAREGGYRVGAFSPNTPGVFDMSDCVPLRAQSTRH